MSDSNAAANRPPSPASQRRTSQLRHHSGGDLADLPSLLSPVVPCSHPSPARRPWEDPPSSAAPHTAAPIISEKCVAPRPKALPLPQVIVKIIETRIIGSYLGGTGHVPPEGARKTRDVSDQGYNRERCERQVRLGSVPVPTARGVVGVIAASSPAKTLV